MDTRPYKSGAHRFPAWFPVVIAGCPSPLRKQMPSRLSARATPWPRQAVSTSVKYSRSGVGNCQRHTEQFSPTKRPIRACRPTSSNRIQAPNRVVFWNPLLSSTRGERSSDHLLTASRLTNDSTARDRRIEWLEPTQEFRWPT